MAHNYSKTKNNTSKAQTTQLCSHNFMYLNSTFENKQKIFPLGSKAKCDSTAPFSIRFYSRICPKEIFSMQHRNNNFYYEHV